MTPPNPDALRCCQNPERAPLYIELELDAALLANPPELMRADFNFTAQAARMERYAAEAKAMQAELAALQARAEAAEASGARKALRAIAAQFAEMAHAAYQDCEYTRRDVWEEAAHQAKFRADKDSGWIDAAIATESPR